MDKFIHRHNLENFRKQLGETKDEAQRRVLMKLVAEEEAEDRSTAQEKAFPSKEGDR
jgi:hypothetical protein